MKKMQFKTSALPLILMVICLGLTRCNAKTQQQITPSPKDVHCNSNTSDVIVDHYDLEIRPDFQNETVRMESTLHIKYLNDKVDTLTLDTRSIEVFSVEAFDEGGHRTPLRFGWGEPNPILGRTLTIDLGGNRPAKVKIITRTINEGQPVPGLSWLKPIQTMGGQKPIFLMMSEPIGLRSLFPCQDTPQRPFTFTAKVYVPVGMIALLSSEDNPTSHSADGCYNFEMVKPIKSYLFSIAIGDFDYKTLDGRCGIYAEKSLLDDAANEFSGLPALVQGCEELFGPFPTKRQDLLLVPAISFSYSAMENPCNFYLSSYMVAKDKSLQYIVSHELAHALFTNIVSHSTWQDVPVVNEGLTEWIRLQILKKVTTEQLWGAQMWLDYQEALKQINLDSSFCLYPTKLEDPDDIFHPISYHKGFLFWLWVEQKVGGSDTLLQRLKLVRGKYQFQSVSTEQLLSEIFNKPVVVADFHEWLEKGGMPADFSMLEPAGLKEIRLKVEKAYDSELEIQQDAFNGITVPEWKYLFGLIKPEKKPKYTLSFLDQAVAPNLNSNNALLESLLLQNYVLAGRIEPIEGRIWQLLSTHSTLRLIRPIYKSLAATTNGKALAISIFEQCKQRYSPTTEKAIRTILEIKE